MIFSHWSSIPLVSYILFGIFVAVSLTHIVICFLEKEKARMITKPMCLAFLSAAVIFAIPTHPLVYIGLLLSMLGDILLLRQHKVLFLVTGTFSFYFAHACFIAEYLIICQPMPYYGYIATAVAYILIVLFGFRFLRKAIKTPALAMGGINYFAIILMDFAWSIIACILGHVDFLILNALGMTSFVFSDAFLVRNLFVKRQKKSHFVIMTSYLLAEALVAVGFTLTLLA